MSIAWLKQFVSRYWQYFCQKLLGLNFFICLWILVDPSLVGIPPAIKETSSCNTLKTLNYFYVNHGERKVF